MSSSVVTTSTQVQEGEGLSETAASPGAASITAIPSESVSIEGAVTKGGETPTAKEGGHVEEPETTAANGGGAVGAEEEDDKDDATLQPQVRCSESMMRSTFFLLIHLVYCLLQHILYM